tara:strand:+ start:378 stop:1295 length:918 start_codon:yes stop_codon:yes gene_type:complete
MPINAHPEHIQAEKEYLLAETIEDKLLALEKMLSTMPTHKGAENLRAQLRLRYKKLKQSIEKSKKSGKSKKQGIKKAEIQAILIGFPNTGKSSLFKALTNQEAKTSPHPFTTYQPQLGTIHFENTKIQLIDSPPFPSHDKSLINSTDTLLLVINSLEQIKQAEKFTQKSPAKIITIYNKSDLLSQEQQRKIQATLKSQKLNFFLISAAKPDNQKIHELKQKIFQTFPVIRIYTKEPHKPLDITSSEPMILKKNSTVKDVAEKISKGMPKKIKQTKIWGPSSKFSGQVVGLEHILKDKDTVEFQTK